MELIIAIISLFGLHQLFKFFKMQYVNVRQIIHKRKVSKEFVVKCRKQSKIFKFILDKKLNGFSIGNSVYSDDYYNRYTSISKRDNDNLIKFINNESEIIITQLANQKWCQSVRYDKNSQCLFSQIEYLGINHINALKGKN